MNLDLNKLNASQREAVEYCDGPSLVIAGAGAGKTRVLTYKIAYLLQHGGLRPWNILALTFTNKAAREMRERIATLVGEEVARGLWMGTFHSVFARILKTECTRLGYEHNFTIYDAADALSLVKRIIKEMGFDDKKYKPSTVAGRISEAKNRLISARQYADDPYARERDKQQQLPQIAAIYLAYETRCRQANAMDFDDLLCNTYRLFREHEDVLAKYAERFEYVLVDEYQDTNYAQHQIVVQLTSGRQRVCVVGDDAQSIYSFRGANIDNILKFTQQYAGARLFKLEQNYRSTQLIVQAANSLIRHNKEQIEKNTFSQNSMGEPLELRLVYSDREEADMVCKQIRSIMRRDHVGYEDFAILYRTNAQSRAFEETLRKNGVPYRIFGGMSFFQRKEIKDIVAYFRLICNHDDEEAFKRIVNFPARGIGQTTLDRVIQAATAAGVSLWQVACQPELYPAGITAATAGKLRGFCGAIDSFSQELGRMDAFTLGERIIKETGLAREINQGMDADDISRQENLQEFMSELNEFVETRRQESGEANTLLPDFLQEISLLTELDSGQVADNGAYVSMMTVHSAKGLEFGTVFVVGMEENIFPSPLSTSSARQLEEERRLFYVAITRAERHCILSAAQNRFRYGRMEFDTPSRFLNDIDRRYLHIVSLSDYPSPTVRPVHPRFETSWQPSRQESKRQPSRSEFRRETARPVPRSETTSPSLFDQKEPREQKSHLVAGDFIEHERFGVGQVLKIEGTGENTKATVAFQHSGTKQLLLKFAKYTKR